MMAGGSAGPDPPQPEIKQLGRYVQLGVLGSGTYGLVVRARDTSDPDAQDVAIKLLPRGGFVKEYRRYVMREVMHHGGLKHPFIIDLKEVFLTPEYLAIVMEFAQGGNLHRFLRERCLHNRLTEDQSRWVFQQMIVGLDFCHRMGVANRDLKLENLLLVRKKDIGHIKIADFGLARRYMGASAMTTICGTPQYVAPEIIKGGPARYGPECDLWSAGVILFILLGGYPPFYDESEPRLFEKIRKGKFDFNDDVWSVVSGDAKDVIKRLLVVDPAKRMTLQEVFEHPWCKSAADDKRELLKTMTRMKTSVRMMMAPPADAAGEPAMESMKSGAVLDLEEQKLADELAAEAR